jgi:hypothetical protein
MSDTAFPTTTHNYGDGIYASTGMTLRDYFAAKAMQGLLADPSNDMYIEDIAKLAYEYADAMLKAREQ